MFRFTPFVVGSALALFLASTAAGDPETREMAGYQTREQLNDFLGRLPARCVAISTENELCSWFVANRQSAWESLAGAIRTKNQVSAICEMPRDGSRRAPETCTLHPRRTAPPDERGPESVLVDLQSCNHPICTSRYVGEVPEQCALSEGAAVSCEWVLSNGSLGFRSVASIADTKRRVRLRCEFPTDAGGAWSTKCKVREDGK